MRKQKLFGVETNFAFILSLGILLSLNVISFSNELLFHFLIETIAIIICCSLFTVIWLLRERIDNGYFTILGIGLFFSAFFDLMHILSFKGMPMFSTMDLNHSTYFFLGGRFVQAITLAVAPVCVNNKTRNNFVLGLFALLTLALMVLIIRFPLPPVISASGERTSARVVIDVVITAILLSAMIFTARKRAYFEKNIFWIIFISMILAILSEVVITLNTNETHLISVLGLNLRLIAYFLIFQIILAIGITQPQDVFYHDLATSREQLQTLFNNLNEGVCTIDQDDNFIFSNPAAEQILMGNSGRLIGQNLSRFLAPEALQELNQQFDNTGKIPNSFELKVNAANHKEKSLIIFASQRMVDGQIDGYFVIFHDISERKATLTKLEDANRIYQSLFEDAPIRIWENDYSKVKIALDELKKNGVSNFREYLQEHPQFVRQMVKAVQIKTYNKLVEKTYARGNPPERITSFEQIFWDKSYDVFINELVAIAEDRDATNYETTTRTPDGRILYSILNFSLISREKRDYSRVIISADDITDRESARLELLSSEEKYRQLAEHAGVGISYFDLSGKVLYLNEKFLSQIGRDPQDAFPTHMIELYEAETAQKIFERMQRVAQSGETLTFVDSIDLLDGRKWLSLTFTRIMGDENHPTGIQIISHDITQQKEMEDQLESLARFPRENPNPVLRLTRSGIVIYSNEGGYPILRSWNYEAEGKVPDYIRVIIQDCLDSGKLEIVEEKVNERVFSLALAPIPDMQYVNIYGRDITDLKDAENQLRRYSQDLEKSVEEKSAELLEARDRLARQEKLAIMGQLASGVGHELRNPLAVINNAVYMLRLGFSKQSEVNTKDYLDIIDQEIAASNKIITDLLTFARIKPANLAVTDLHHSLDEVLKKFVAPENVEVKIELPDDLPNVTVDEKQIEQVIANIVTNAYQAITDRGSLTVTGKVERRMVRMDFTDTGIGIPPENLERIFEPLFSTKTKGIGLGLTISKMLAEANGGKIKVRSQLNHGTTLSLYLPLEQKKN
ncbi:MAG: hypothetical protein PWQ55_81 [Chloroflexota bacterium]|nr:hypothetical protein [Chloroflexota bacterium]